ncbi:MAG: hypothetical protein ABMB14_19645 [Myxococcota bacterium]
MDGAPDERVVALSIDGWTAGDHVRLQVDAEGGACAFADGIVVDGGVRMGLLDAALATWLGPKVGIATGPLDPCDGLPPVNALAVPPTGWAIGLRAAADTVDVVGPLSVHAIPSGAPSGSTGSGGPGPSGPSGGPEAWWHLHVDGVESGTGFVVFHHPDGAPPTRFAVRIEPGLVVPAASTTTVATGGVVVVGYPSTVSFAEAQPDGVASVIGAGENLVVIGRRPGVADAVVRSGSSVAPVRVEVVGPPGPVPGEILVPIGHRRVVIADHPIRAAWIGDESLATAEIRRERLIVRGLAPGRTAVGIALETGEVVAVPLACGH